MATKKQPNDFDLGEILSTTTEHQKTLDDILARVTKIEECLESPDKMGEKMSSAIESSTPLRKSLGTLILDLMNDHDTRANLIELLGKIDRVQFWRWGKYVAGAVVWVATVVGAVAIFK